MEKLAIFDVDYTITNKETLMEFYKFMIKKDRRILRHLPKNFIAVLCYVLKIFDARKAKEYFISFIDGIDNVKMQELVKEFYEEKLSKIFYKDAIDTLVKLKEQGFKIYLISASAEFYLKELYNIKEVDMVIGTKFKMENNLHKRHIEGANCKGEEKVKRLFEVLEKENIEVDFKSSYMFSDSLSDLPLLNLVGNPRLINYKRGHRDIEVLNWK